jgi:hypothetical protein
MGKSLAAGQSLLSLRLGKWGEHPIPENDLETAFGRQPLTLWKMTGFEPVPAGYAATLTTIATLSPAPVKEKVAKTD